MNIFNKIQERFKTASEVAEKVAQGVAQEYEKNSTPTDSFLQEAKHWSGPQPSAGKSHPFFPLTSPSVPETKGSADPNQSLKHLAFQLGRERRRAENEEGASAAIPLLLIKPRVALTLGDTVTADRLSARLMDKSREAAAAKALAPVQDLVGKGELTATDLKDHQPYLAIVSTEGGKLLAATPFF